MNTGLAIKTIRKKLSLTQNQLAVKCNLTKTSLSLIENGIQKPSSRTISRICKSLDIPEMIVYIAAMEAQDVPEPKRHAYEILYPTMIDLAMRMVHSPEPAMV
jgi:transcriptional regulator with XRE-family HTH domain